MVSLEVDVEPTEPSRRREDTISVLLHLELRENNKPC
jgi:hypothetical protein